MSLCRRWSPTTSSRIVSATPAGSRTRSVAAMPAPHWFFRFMYDRESAAWERRRDEPGGKEDRGRDRGLGPSHFGTFGTTPTVSAVSVDTTLIHRKGKPGASRGR